MKNYIELRNYQLISSYGGIGSIIETLGGALIILPFDKWIFYKQVIEKSDAEDLDELSIYDPRLLAKIKQDFPALEYLIQVPSNNLAKGGAVPMDKKNIVSVEHFPSWFYCPKCHNFMEKAEWDFIWKLKQPQKYKPERHYTMCPYCSVFSVKKTKLFPLEQVRFIQISEKGDIRDFLWREWFDDAIAPIKCTKHKLKYKPSSFSDNFENIHVSCSECKQDTTLKGIFGYSENSEYKTVLRSSNNVYFPKIISSILIPGASGGVAMNDQEFKLEEYDHILRMVSQGTYRDQYLYLKPAGTYGSLQTVSIREMTMSSVLCSYTRTSPQSAGHCYEKGRSKHVTSSGSKTKYLPATRSSGEGLMILFDDRMIRAWYDKNTQNYRFLEAITRTMTKGANSSYYGSDYFLTSKYGTVKFILLHTLSHLLIKQLEYTCGYPATSLNERIYTSSEDHAGIIIYSITGSEGSYGGLVSEVETGYIPHLLEEAVASARFCRADPVCYESGSICFSCTLIPETSCEISNRYLDRSLVVDSEYGFATILCGDKLAH